MKEGSNGRQRRLAAKVACIVIVGAAAYANTFDVPFAFDDRRNIVDNVAVRDVGTLLKLWFTTDPVTTDRYEFSRTRALSFLTLALDYKVHGARVAGYHGFNLAVHIGSACAVFWLLSLLLRSPRLRGAEGIPGRTALPWIVALLFVAHPLQTQAVTYIVQRMASLAALMYLLATSAYLAARIEQRRGRRRAFYGLAIAAALGAIHAKENTVTLPAMIVLMEWLFLEGGRRSRALAVAPFFAIALLAPVYRLIGRTGAGAAFAAVSGDNPVTPVTYLMTQFGVIVSYLRLLIVPTGLNLDHDRRLYTSLADPAVFGPLLLLLALGALAVVLARAGRRAAPGSERSHLLLPAFGLAWFFLALAVESSVVPIDDLMFEHRMYLPSVGILLCMVSGVWLLLARHASQRGRLQLAAALVAVLVVGLAAATVARNQVWRSELSLWGDVVSKSPNKWRGHLNHGRALGVARRHAEALKAFTRAIQAKPNCADCWLNRGILLLGEGQIDRSVLDLTRGVALAPGDPKPHAFLGRARSAQGQRGAAIRHYEDAIARGWRTIDVYVNVAILYKATGRLHLALARLRRALVVAPNSAVVHYNLGNTLYVVGDFASAATHFARAVALQPDVPDYHHNLAMVYRRLGRPADAAHHLRRATQLRRGRKP